MEAAGRSASLRGGPRSWWQQSRMGALLAEVSEESGRALASATGPGVGGGIYVSPLCAHQGL